MSTEGSGCSGAAACALVEDHHFAFVVSEAHAVFSCPSVANVQQLVQVLTIVGQKDEVVGESESSYGRPWECLYAQAGAL